MTSSVTKLPAASNGSEKTTDAPSAERKHGIDRVQEQLIYHVATFAGSVLYEAERLMHDLSTTASQRSLDDSATKRTEPVDMDLAAAIISETLECIDVASEQLSRLNVDIRMRLEPGGF